MASDASLQFLAEEPNWLTSFGVAFKIFAEGSGTPIIPVEAIKTSFCEILSYPATFLVISSQSFNPFEPETALALPLLTITARHLPDFVIAFRLQVTLGDPTRFLVNTAAALAETSEITSARSLM